jgi:hypothetical protein
MSQRHGYYNRLSDHHLVSDHKCPSISCSDEPTSCYYGAYEPFSSQYIAYYYSPRDGSSDDSFACGSSSCWYSSSHNPQPRDY